MIPSGWGLDRMAIRPRPSCLAKNKVATEPPRSPKPEILLRDVIVV
jgi:hypothetical protein